jgi:hypothetical protein
VSCACATDMNNTSSMLLGSQTWSCPSPMTKTACIWCETSRQACMCAGTDCLDPAAAAPPFAGKPWQSCRRPTLPHARRSTGRGSWTRWSTLAGCSRTTPRWVTHMYAVDAAARGPGSQRRPVVQACLVPVNPFPWRMLTPCLTLGELRTAAVCHTVVGPCDRSCAPLRVSWCWQRCQVLTSCAARPPAWRCCFSR